MQFAGLDEGQARFCLKIDFQINTALTTVKLSKVAHHLSISEGQHEVFSMSNTTNTYANEWLALRNFNRCRIDPSLSKYRHKKSTIQQIY